MKGKNKQSQYNTQAVHICCISKKQMKEGVFSSQPAPRILTSASSVCLRRN